MKKTTKKKGRRGGRKPGTWSLVKPEAILAHRKERKLSRASLAEMLGVSQTTIQNWESGKAVATPKAQARIVEVLRSGGSRPATSGAPKVGGNGQHAGGYDSTVEATGRIVAALLASAKIKPQDLRGIIQEVRAALA